DLAGEGAKVWNDPSMPINQMGVNDIAGNYVKYIGAGMMLCGGIIGAIKLIPTIIASVKETMNAKSSSADGEGSTTLQTMILLGGIVVAVIGA
ncbi:OPT/YSL family transporter, partial [Casaltella massiliensis]|nr:OPT/YSL family transporter [Casaltella massiliensis]